MGAVVGGISLSSDAFVAGLVLCGVSSAVMYAYSEGEEGHKLGKSDIWKNTASWAAGMLIAGNIAVGMSLSRQEPVTPETQGNASAPVVINQQGRGPDLHL